MLINFTNHPSQQWKTTQLSTAVKQFGKVSDMSFPAIDPEWDDKKIRQLAENYHEKIIQKINDKQKDAVLIMGEHTFSFALICKLQKAGIFCYATTSHRIVTEEEKIKMSTFKFERFRKYPPCI